MLSYKKKLKMRVTHSENWMNRNLLIIYSKNNIHKIIVWALSIFIQLKFLFRFFPLYLAS